jgi:beta-xylosidase
MFLWLIAMAVARAQSHRNPILPGDHPDPSIIGTGNTYWTISTSGNRTPAFPLFHSTALAHWTAAGLFSISVRHGPPAACGAPVAANNND